MRGWVHDEHKGYGDCRTPGCRGLGRPVFCHFHWAHVPDPMRYMLLECWGRENFEAAVEYVVSQVWWVESVEELDEEPFE